VSPHVSESILFKKEKKKHLFYAVWKYTSGQRQFFNCLDFQIQFFNFFETSTFKFLKIFSHHFSIFFFIWLLQSIGYASLAKVDPQYGLCKFLT
jgi:hypothetical protein